MRGIAVLLVVLFHFGLPHLGGGFIGVDVFFVLSGYLITGLIFKEIQRTGRLNYRNFYARRVRRLLPAAALVLICTLLVGTAVYSPLEILIHVRTAMATALYMSNAIFLHWASNYFAPQTAGNPFLHTWSLAVEEQFYLVWPALIAVLCWKPLSKGRLALALGAVAAISFVLCFWLTFRNEPWAFFASPLRAWEFAVGGLAVLIDTEWLRSHKKLLLPLSMAGLCMVLAPAVLFRGQQGFPGALAAIPVVGTALILMAGAVGEDFGLNRLLSSRPLLELGRLSYSWYLWHWPVLVIGTARFPALGTRGRILLAVLSLSLSYATFKLVENPIRYNKKLVAMPRLSLSLAGIVPIAIVGLSMVIGLKASRDSHRPEQQAVQTAANDHSPIRDKCIVLPGAAELRECSYGDTSAKETVALFGDSHADHWFVALNDIALRHHWHLVTLLKSSCPTAAVPIYN
jgi:peptidoglycan/LPS O-acetylase OafA/YrhL